MGKTKMLYSLIKDENLTEAPAKTELVSTHYEFIIGIGKDHTARIILDEDAYNELLKIKS